jgi:hypothetical protein
MQQLTVSAKEGLVQPDLLLLVPYSLLWQLIFHTANALLLVAAEPYTSGHAGYYRTHQSISSPIPAILTPGHHLVRDLQASRRKLLHKITGEI